MNLIKTLLFATILFLVACKDKEKKQNAKSDTYETSKMTISEIESKNPKIIIRAIL